MSADTGLYKPTDLQELKRRLAAKDSKGGGAAGGNADNGFNWYKFPLGVERVVVRYLPSPNGIPGKIVKKHYNMPEIGDTLCLRTHDMDCPTCELLHGYENKLDTSDWAASTKAYLTALIISDDSRKANPIDPKVPHIINSNEGNLYWVYGKIMDPDIGDICDPKNGFNVAYQRQNLPKDGMPGKFDRTILPKAQPIAPTQDEIDSILGKTPDLDKIWRRPDDVFLKKVIDATEKLKVIIDQRVMTLSSKPDETTVATNEVINQNTSTASSTTSTSQAQAAAAPKSNKPSSAPGCFADAKVFYKNEATGEDDLSKTKCVSCPFDFHCGEEIKKFK